MKEHLKIRPVNIIRFIESTIKDWYKGSGIYPLDEYGLIEKCEETSDKAQALSLCNVYW